MVNAQALTETLEAVEEQVTNGTGLFNQGEWAGRTTCGTAGCFAGWRAFLDGYTVLDEAAWQLVNRETGESLPLPLWPWSKEGVTVASYAQQRFGLDQDQAWTLFAGGNSLQEIREMVAALIGADEECAE